MEVPVVLWVEEVVTEVEVGIAVVGARVVGMEVVGVAVVIGMLV